MLINELWKRRTQNTGRKTIFKGIMAKYFPDLMYVMNPQFQEV